MLITNNDGRFEVMSVDDKIPVSKQTYQPVWGMSFKNPWELILMKAWAKKLRGYNRVVSNTRAFEFIENFSNPTWKYYNLTKSLNLFLNRYTSFNRFRFAKIVLKTKDEERLREHGLIPNSASYEIVNAFTEQKNEKEVTHFLAIRGTAKSSWPGNIGYLDQKAVRYFKEMNPAISLDRGFLISGEELLNNFSAAYVTSNRENYHYYTGYKILEIGENEKKAQYFEFFMPENGFFDFCIKQFGDNQVSAGNQSQMQMSSTSQNSGSRYLRNKYVLVRDNQLSAKQ